MDWEMGAPQSSHDKQELTTYVSVTEAIEAILNYNRTAIYSQSAIDWVAASALIVEGADDLQLDATDFLKLEVAADAAGWSAREISEVLLVWGSSNWPLVQSALITKALDHFVKGVFYASYDSFCRFIERWSRLKDDSELLNRMIETMACNESIVDACIPRLRAMKGDKAAAERVLAIVMVRRFPFERRDELASLLAEWASASAWGQLQHLLWRIGAKSDRLQTTLDLSTQSVSKVADLLKEFGVLSPTPSYRLSELSAESKASWRRELKISIGEDKALRYAVTEALFWFGPTQEDRAVLFAVLELHGDDLETALKLFKAHPDDLVRRRAKAVIDMFRLEPDATTLIQARTKPAMQYAPDSVCGLNKARTWIRDARIEQLIEGALDAAAGVAGRDIESSLDSGEETHLMLLLGELKAAFISITDQLEALAAETNANDHLSLKLEYRVVGKKEEGGAGVGTKKFSADVCLLFEARDAGKRFARRASLLQAKRLSYKNKLARYPIDVGQLEDLSGQTLASFLLLLGPECEGVRIPIIPARLMLDLIERGEPSTQIAPVNASHLGKSIGTWLVEDVIGLWTGDGGKEIITHAEGGEHRKPLVLVTLVVDRVPKAKDGWPSARRR